MHYPRGQKRKLSQNKIIKNFILSAYFAFSISLLSMGMALVLVKSPEQKSKLFLEHALEYQKQSQVVGLSYEAKDYFKLQAHDMIIKAIQKTPYDKNVWKQYSHYLSQARSDNKALEAHSIATTLGSDTHTLTMQSNRFKAVRHLALLDKVQ